MPACLRGALHQLAGRPVEIVLVEVDLGQRIAVMRVEAGGNDDQVRPEIVERRQDARLERLAKDVAAGAGRQRRVDDVAGAGLVLGAGAGIERHLVGRAVEHRRIVPEDVLRAVAVMDVPVDDGDALGAMLLLRMAGGDRGIVEQAKAHRGRALGMVAGRPRRDEDIVGRARIDVVDRGVGGADRRQRRLPALRAHRGIGVDAHDAGLGHRLLAAVRHSSPGARQARPRYRPAATACGRARENSSPSSTRAIARNRSGRSGWPGGVMCSR